MKVGELLSGPTIGSSRALTIYSGTVLAVLWTETSLEKLPGIGWLGDNDQIRYAIILIVLLFMFVSFLANWLNDYCAINADSVHQTFLQNNKTLDPTAQAEQYLEKLQTANPLADTAKRLIRLTFLQKLMNFVVRYFFHLIVPVLSAVVAGVTISLKLCNESGVNPA